MEKCGKVWRPDQAAAARQEAREGFYLISGGRQVSEIRACSACAGDYEDPDRTAGTPDDAEDEEDDSATRGGTEKFPAEE